MNIETSAAFENWAMLLSGVLLHSLWQGAIIVMLVAVMVRWVKCSAALRSSVYMIGLIGIVISFLSTGLLIRQPSSATFGASEIAGRSIDSVAIVAADRRSENSTRTPALNFTENDQSANVIEASPKRWVVLARFIAGFYLLGVLLMAGRLFCGVTGSRRLRSKAERIKDRSVLQMVERMSDAIMLRVRPPVVAFSSEVVTPAVVGVLRPMILLPVGLLSSIPQEQVEAIIAHELAHLRRFDHIGLLVQRFVETVAFYHPAVWWLSRKLADAREESCDEIVLSCGCDRADYAESLLTMNEWARGALTSDHGRLALGVAGRKQVLRKRLLRILGVMPAPARRHRFSCDVGLVGALATLLICGVVGVPFLVKAQEGGGVAPIGAELSPKPDVRIPGLHPVEREVIEKIERLVRKSRALAKTEDEQGSKDSERPPSVDLLYKAIELLEIYCEESSHPELLRLHRTVNLLAGRPGSAEEFQAWIVPSQHLRRATELADKGQWQAAKVDYLKAFDTRPEKAGWRDYGYLQVLAELHQFDEAVEFVRSREVEGFRRSRSSFPWGAIDDYPAVPIPLSSFSSGSGFTGSRLLSGEVTLSIMIAKDGRASLNGAVSPVDGIPSFSESIQRMVSRWRFAPRQENGNVVETNLEIPFWYKTNLPSVAFEVDDQLKIEDVEREVSKIVMTYGVCNAHIQVHSDASYAMALQVFKTCVDQGATVVNVIEESRPKAWVPAPPPPPPEIDINGLSQLRLNNKSANLKQVIDVIRQYQVEFPDSIQLSVHTAADLGFVGEVTAAVEQVLVTPLVVKHFSKYAVRVTSVGIDDISADGKIMLVSRPNRVGLALLSVSSFRNDLGEQPEQSFLLPVLSKGTLSLDGQSVTFDEISNWRSLAGSLTGTKPGAVRLLLKPDASFGYALDVFEDCQSGGNADIFMSIFGAP